MDGEVNYESMVELSALVRSQAAELESLRHEVHDLRAEVVSAAPELPASASHATQLSRSNMLKTIGVVAAGAVAVTALGTGTAAAADGQSLILGHSAANGKPNKAKLATEILFQGKVTAGIGFLVNDTKFSPAGTPWPAAVGAWAGSHFPHGLYAYTDAKTSKTIPPTALAAFSLYGYGGYFSGPKAQISLEPQKGLHPGAGKAGDLFVDSNHDLWFCKGGTDWYHIV